MGKYIFIFFLVACAVTAVIVGVAILFDWDIPAAAVEIPRALVACFISAYFFMKDHARMPTGKESIVFTLGAFLSLILMSVLGVAILYMVVPDGAEFLYATWEQIKSSSQLVIFMSIFLVVYLLILGAALIWFFRWYCKIKLKEIERKST